MKKLKRTVGVFLCLVLMLTSFSLLFFRKEKIGKGNECVALELWHIDTFEGGKGSRRNLLLEVGKIFEKENEKTLLTVITETVESAEEKFKKGVFPDMISYGAGIEGVLPLATEIKNVKNPWGGWYNGKIYACPYIKGSYVYLKRKGVSSIEKIYISKSTYTQPLIALYQNDILKSENLGLESVEEKSPVDAYYGFISGKNSALLGTQRDLFRLEKRGFEVEVYPLEGFTDLVQYISVTAKVEERKKLSFKFVDLLLKEGQKQAWTVGMMPIDLSLKNGDNGIIAPLFTVNYNKTLSVFTTKTALFELNAFLCSEEKTEDQKNKYIENALNHLK